LGSRATLFVRYNDSPSSNQFGAIEVNRLDLRFKSLALGLNLRASSKWTIDIRASESQAEAHSTWSKPGQPVGSGCDLEPMTSFLFPPSISPTCNALVRFSIGGVGQVVAGDEGIHRQRQFQYVSSAVWNSGAHGVRFGVDLRRIVPIRRDAMGVESAIADDITALTDKKFLWLGLSTPISRSTEVTELSLWAQDTWRISQRVTVTAGTRWEYDPPPQTVGRPYFLNPATNTIMDEPLPLWPVAYNNFAPRLSVAWSLTKSGNTVLRGGAGTFYDSSLSIATDLINNGPLNISQLVSGRAGLFSSLLTFGFMPDLKLPRIMQWNLTLDRSFGAHDALSIGYVGANGRRLLRREAGGAGSSPTTLTALTTDHGSSDYEGLQTQYRRRVTQGLQVLASYSWSHSLDDDSSDAFLVWAGPGSSRLRDHASSDFDLRHSLTASLSYELPHRNTSAGRIFSGWAIDGLWRARSGFPITVVQNEQYEGIPLANAFRPDLVYGVPLWLDDASMPGDRRLNPAAFALTNTAVQGTLGRNSIAGFGMSQIDLALRRDFRWHDRYGLQLRLEAFNATNHANFADPVRYLNSAVFGQSTSMLNVMLGTGSPGSGLAPILQTGGPRSLQGTLRFRF
jgi:hypothetical protein